MISVTGMSPWLLLSVAISLPGAEVPEPLLRELPPGLAVQSSLEVPAAKASAIGQRLGGRIERLTNSVIRVHGQAIGVNVLVAASESEAEAIERALAKPAPLSVRQGRTVVEYVGQRVDAALARKTSYELGLVPKPPALRYRVVAELAPVDRGDPLDCNALLNRFLEQQAQPGPEAAQRIEELAGRFTFGRTLVLRNPALDGPGTTVRFEPAPRSSTPGDATVAYAFDALPAREGIPFVTATIEVTVPNSGLRPAPEAPGSRLTAATRTWPVDDPAIQALAARLTAGCTTPEAQVAALLQWLAPGRNLRYAGDPGSRWGTARVLEQKFGRCWDFSDVFVTLARAAGVPSRQVAGWLYGGGGHVWAEYYREGQGWQPVDPTGGGVLACGLYHIPYFTSDDGELRIAYLGLPQIEIVNGN